MIFFKSSHKASPKSLGHLRLRELRRQPFQKFAQKTPQPTALKPPSTARTAGRSDRAERRFRRQPFILLSFSSPKNLRKAQETQSYQRFQCIGHTNFKGLSSVAANTPTLLSSMGIIRQKMILAQSSTKRPTFVFAGESEYTHGSQRKIAHSGLHGETGAFRMRVVSLPSDRFARFGNPAWPGIRTAYFAAFGSWSGVLPKNAESLRDSDALMRVAVPQASRPRWAA